MSDLTARAIADLKAELAESKAAANRVTESMGSEIMRLTAELEQQRTRAEAAEQELRAEKQRGNSAWDDGYAKSLARAKAVEAGLAAVTRHRDDLLASIKRDCETMAATGVKETLLRDAIPVLAQQRDEARARLAAIRAHLPAIVAAQEWLAGVNVYEGDDPDEAGKHDEMVIREFAVAVAAAREALEP